jgi:tricorn protease
MNGLRILGAAFLLGLVCSAFAPGQQEARLLRFPAIHDNQIVFSYAGDLYTVDAAGGVARKLTNDPGYELFARFSPDGKSIAFTGQYDGNTEVYLMPSEGGVPKRLTYTATLGRDDVSDRMGPNNIVMSWRDDKSIVYRSRRIEHNDFIGQLFLASVDGGIPEQLPLPRGGFCSFSPDGKQMAYNRVFREFRTWKRYRGGQADDIWIYDFATKGLTNITENPAQDIIPMWSGSKIYFASDRDELRKMNIYVYDLTTKQTKKLTNFTEYDVKFPSLGNNALVFENGGYIYKLDLATEQVVKVPISILEDFAVGRGGLRDVSKEVTNFEISPDGNRALFGARGDVFTVPAKYGNTRNITGTPGVHERNSKWSPDGKYIAYVSDASGEDEVWIEPQDGSAAPTRITSGGDTYKYQILWSPDSKKILWSDKKLRLQYVDVASKGITTVAQATAFEITDYNWSPDSKWIAYARPEEKGMTTVRLYSLDKKDTYAVTDGWFDSSQPVFSADGKFLYFVSDRTFNPTFNNVELNANFNDMSGLFLVALAKDTKSPFAPKSDEVTIKEDKPDAKKDEGKDKKKEEPKASVKVDVEGLQSRVTSIPVAAGGYRNLETVGDKLYYIRGSAKDDRPQIYLYELDKQKETALGAFNGFEISSDGKKMIVSGDGGYSIIDLPSAKIDAKEQLSLGDMKVVLDRRAEWNQIFNECWRQMRDFFFAPNMHGVDWPKMRDRYAALLPYVSHRADLTYIIGEMISELSVGHAYVGGGDYPKPNRIPQGLLGARVERDPASKFFRIKKILKGQNWDKSLRSPLTEMGVDAREGDYITAVNGTPTNTMSDLYEALVNTVGKQVTLTLNTEPKAGGRTTVVVPTGDERNLYYFNWVQDNIDKVTKATDGKVGYVHIPDMGAGGLIEFTKYFYPQTRKEALIVDVRGNGGGFVSPIIIERLQRQLAMIDIARNSAVTLDPSAMVLGPKVLLADEFSASDGDIVTYRFKKYKLGPVIGKRTWGGVVGIRGSLPLLDGGFLNRPEFSRYGTDGQSWIMEGVGVEPDIFVDNDPAREFAGTDDQLTKAIEVIKEEMKKNPATLPPPPPYPDKH